MKIASQLASSAADNNMKAASAEDSGNGFQSVFANATGMAKSEVSPVPASKDASASPRTAETKKKDASEQSPIAALPLTLAPVAVSQAVVLPVDDGALAQKESQKAEGGSVTGQFAAPAGTDPSLAMPANDGGVEASGAAGSMANGPEAGANRAGAAARSDAGAALPGSNGSVRSVETSARTESAAGDAAKAKASPSDGPLSETEPMQPGPIADSGATAEGQSIAASAQFAAMSSFSQLAAGQLSGKQPQESASPAGAIKAPAGIAAKGKSASDDPRGKKSDGADSDQPAGGVGAPFAAKVSDAMSLAPRNAGGAQSAIDAAGLQQMASHAAGPMTGQTAGQAAATAQDGKPTVDTAAQAASSAQGPAGADAMPGVSSAHLVQSANSSEMRLGMQSAEFGNISISTSLNHQALSAQISIDHSELGRALATHLPAIEEKLGTAYGVQAKVELRDSSNPSQSGHPGYSNSGQQAKEQRQSQAGVAQGGTTHGDTVPALGQDLTMARMSALTSSAVLGATTASRLDIRI